MQTTHANRSYYGPAEDRGSGEEGAPAVGTEGLTKRFGDRIAVDDVSLVVPRGVAYGFLGHNGAGKTTLIRVLLGLTRASSGRAHVLGLPVPAERAAALARVGAIVEESSFYSHLTAYENLKVAAAVRGPETVRKSSRCWSASASTSALGIASGRTRSGCAGGSAWRVACCRTPSC